MLCLVVCSFHHHKGEEEEEYKTGECKSCREVGAPEKTVVQQQLTLPLPGCTVVLVVTVQHRQRRYQNVNTLTERIGKESVRQTQTKSSPTDRDRQEEEGFPLKNSRGRITSKTFAGTDNSVQLNDENKLPETFKLPEGGGGGGSGGGDWSNDTR